ncbi:DUF3156 family protein [Pseudomonas panipatensis]|uniref:DUF3156 family protein n=1 Tax=Pseudomonas panipatensis TaxID=428992 RepID=A0A1G8GC61_9PSED|nr:DUF3156 family protein [Pseudomonas panipatensis]SDH91906.1 Protein of unknown function [Pseudomonas panipatensis]SMP44313.1 Protein of unknown function [Pseudomonas panipatensis]
MFAKLCEWFGRAPSGYRPGVTLEQARRNLAGLTFQALAPGLGRFGTVDGGLVFELHERPLAQFLMHLVLTEFVLERPALDAAEARFELRHSGALRRQGLVCRQRAGDPALGARLAERLGADAHLQQALLPLDFKRLRLERGAGRWRVRLEHMGASEVVNRMPSFRRYVQLSREQRDYLLRALFHLQRLLGDL